MKLFQRLKFAPGFALIGVALAAGSALSAAAGQLGAPYENEAKLSVAASTRALLLEESDAIALGKIWESRCSKFSEHNTRCFVQECELPAGTIEKALARACDPSRVLLFRGEAALHPTPAIAHLARTHVKLNSSYSPSANASALIARLESDLVLLGHIAYAPEDGFDLVRDAEYPQGKWFYRLSEDETAPGTPVEITQKGKALSSAGLIFGMHAMAAEPMFRDPVLKKTVSLDPMVSFSTNPGQALAFARSDEGATGRLIIATLPESAIVRDCSGALPAPNRFFDPADCDVGNEYSDEAEVDAVLYPKDSHILGSLRISPQK